MGNNNGINSNLLIDIHPELLDEFDYNKNMNIDISMLTCGTDLKIWWRCMICHGEYQMRVSHRTSGHGCPYCAGARVLRGYNDLASQRPSLLSEWDYDANINENISPDNITLNSHVKASWLCSQYKHSFEMPICDRVKGKGCPYCANRKILIGFNDLNSMYPELVESEWDWIRNNAIKLYPNMITYGSGRMAYWHCASCGYEWQARVSHRTGSNSGCPYCAKHRNHHISAQENQVAEFIRAYFNEHDSSTAYTMMRSISFKEIYLSKELVCNDEELCKHMMSELDIYIPELGLAVEYDGDYWHSDEIMMRNKGMTNEEAHEIKKELCSQAGIELIFISEHDWVHDNGKTKTVISNFLETMLVNRHIE